MGTFLLCKRFVTGGHCPEAEFMITTEHQNHRFLNVLLLIVTFEAPALYSVLEMVPQQYWARKTNHWILLLLVCRRLLLTDARLFLQTDIFTYTSSRLFYRAEFLMSSKVKSGEQGRRRSWLIWRLKGVWRGKKKKAFPAGEPCQLSRCLLMQCTFLAPRSVHP